MILRKNNKRSFLISSTGRYKGLFLSLFILFFVSGKLLAQDYDDGYYYGQDYEQESPNDKYAYLKEFEVLYPNCFDNEYSIVFGGTYPQPWPKNLNPPVFPGGGDIQLTRFVHMNAQENYPDVVDYYTRERVKGTVHVEVVIDRCGKPSRQRVVKSVDELYDLEALRIAEGLPVFKPGSINGERVKVALIIPVHFIRNTMPPKKKYDYRDLNYDDIPW
jgi:TonB family protein